MMTATPTAPSKAPEKISGMFDRIAGTYDLLNDCMTGGMHRAWKRAACQSLQLPEGGSVLDVCTGTGDLTPMLAQCVGAAGRVTGLDFSADMLAVARKRFAQQSNLQFQQGDALALPFAKNAFNGAVISFGLRNVADVSLALSEMTRVVAPGGRIAILDTASDCRSPFFWLYFRLMMPLLGRLLSGDASAYRYLCQSTETFETPAMLAQHLQHAGLAEVTVTKMGFGSVVLLTGLKRFSGMSNILQDPA